MFKKLYKKLFFRNALKLFLSSVSYNIINCFAVLFFSKAKKPTKMLLLTNKLLNKKICECQKLQYRCEYLKSKLKNSDDKYAPV